MPRTSSFALLSRHMGGVYLVDMAHYEIEIKSLLGPEENAIALKEKMHAVDPATICTSTNSQLNHYFTGGDITTLYEEVKGLFKDDVLAQFTHMVEKGSSFSVRTRQKDDEVLLVVKASIDEGTSENAVARLEFEAPVALSLDELDAIVLQAGFTYQAKWSRVREEYICNGTTVCLDKNAGYGYLAEFEKVVPDESAVEEVRNELYELMALLGAEELAQDRLERMFAHYNEHWPLYYGTEKTFIIE